VLGSWLFSRLVVAWITGTNERVGFGLDGVCKFPEILAHMAQVVEQFINVIGVYVERLIDPAGELRHIRKRRPQLKDGFVNVLSVFSDEGIDMIQSLIRLG
jgi:hypothetical protein